MGRGSLVAAAAAALMMAAAACGCAPGAGVQDAPASQAPSEGAVILEDTCSPNERYVSSEDDAVYYTVRVTQDASRAVTVTAESNSAFFDPLSYTVACDRPLSADDASIEWTTAMGDREASEDDQLCVAVVSVDTGQGSVDTRKVNFASRALDMAAEAVAS